MKCCKCNASIPDNAVSCPRCGAPQGFSEELIRRARNNDQDALAELYERTYSSVYTAVRTMVSDDDEALDILQDSYLKAFRSLDKLEDPEKFRAWIKRIARNQTIDVLRQKQPIVFSTLESEDSDGLPEFEDECEEHLPEAVIDRQETARLMREILDTLPEEQKVAISLFYYEQMSVKEIAEELGVAENTVKSRLNYGRKKVEKEVRALEKKGTKLYGLAPIPFLMLLFRSQEAAAASSTALQSIAGSLAAETAIGAAAGTAAGAASGAAGSAAGTAAASAAGNTAAQAAGAAAKTAAGAAGHVLRTKLIAGAAALVITAGGGAAVYQHLQNRPEETVQVSAESTEEEQILPDSFLKDMDVLAKEKLKTVLNDYEYLEIKGEQGTTDVPVQYIADFSHFSVNGPHKTVFYESGGAAMYFLVYLGNVLVDPDWANSIAVPIPTGYSAVVFVLDSFPLKFLHEDGSIEYKKEDMRLYKVYASVEDFDAEIEDLCRYVEHDLYEFVKPPDFYWEIGQ